MPDYTLLRMAASLRSAGCPITSCDSGVRSTCFGRVEPTWWGAVVTDPRFPAVWDVELRAGRRRRRRPLRSMRSKPRWRPRSATQGRTVEHVVSFSPGCDRRSTEPAGSPWAPANPRSRDGGRRRSARRRPAPGRRSLGATPTCGGTSRGRSACSASTSRSWHSSRRSSETCSPHPAKGGGSASVMRDGIASVGALMLLEEGRLHRQRRRVRTRPQARARERRDHPHRQGSEGPPEPRHLPAGRPRRRSGGGPVRAAGFPTRSAGWPRRAGPSLG